ncbi:hypothetical protein KKD49_02790, partial [Myxococcota bacterium]|nr:hypothetical protein [Myxococcota bacterium]
MLPPLGIGALFLFPFPAPPAAAQERGKGWCAFSYPALTSRADKLAPVWAQAHDPQIQHRVRN